MSPGIAYATAAYTAWGLFPLYFRQLAQVSALEVIAHRTLWSMLFVALVLLVRRQWAWLAPLLRQPRLLAVSALSALLLSANWLLYVWAVNNGHVLDASLGYFILPLINVALGYAVLGERPRRGQWAAVAVAACGVLWLALQAGRLPWIGLAIALTFGGYGLLRKTAPLGALEGLALETTLLTPLALALLAWWAGQGTAAWTQAGAADWLWLLAAGPITAVPLLLFAAGARRVPLATLGLLQYISPSLQFLLGVALMGESVQPARLLGFALIWTALALFALEGAWQRRAATV
ncbi:EamA family transporter RarD [Melaminivora jejuensis]|uniref:EamA family transporter RarD n=1 Tax=Melaminivora jejuensis TaxID=1267217 RepID=UPI001E653A79|nr:EamA family transporter RarD [Melaminivora jejuensis]UHJ65562.1 EamA family transporter RarD [Melaminivora jejuensis]